MRSTKKSINRTKYFSDSILPIIFWILLIFGFDSPDVAILTILAALMHELGHISAMLALGVRHKLRGHVSGFRIRSGAASYLSDIIILLAGPLSNIAAFLITLPFGNLGDGYVRIAGIISLVTGLSSLAPIEGYDGYGALSKLAMAHDATIALTALNVISASLSVLFAFLSLYLMLKFGEGYWIFGVFFLYLTSKIQKNLSDMRRDEL